MAIVHTGKVITAIAILLALLIGAGIFSYSFLSTSSEKLQSYIEQIEDSTRTGEWEKAKEKLSFLEKDWEKTEKRWAMLIDHLEMDHIDSSISKTAKYIETKDQALALGEISTLKQYVKHIPTKEWFSIENIL